MNTCEVGPAPISVGVQVIPYIFSSFSEILAAITGLEFAFTKAPKNMRSLVMAIFLFMNAFSAALSQAFTALSEDPLLVWDYATVAIVSFIGGNVFWLAHRKLDKEEDRLNMLVESSYIGKGQGSGIDDVEKSRVAEPVEAEKKDFAVA